MILTQLAPSLFLLSQVAGGGQAGPPQDPGSPGKYSVENIDAKIPRKKADEAEARIYYPKDAEGISPVIIFSPGGDAPTYQGYEDIGQWFSGWGYATIIVAFNNKSPDERGEQYSEALDWIIKKNSEEGWPLKGKIDAKKVVAAGHSRGGWASVVAAKRDKRFQACLALAPSGPQDVKGDAQPALCLISGDQDDQKMAGSLYQKFKKSRFQVTIKGADHFFNVAEKRTLFLKYATAFLNYKIRGDKKYAKYFKGESDVQVRMDE